MAYSNDSRELARRLDGQTMVIPDLRQMMSHWPSGKNAHCAEIEAIIRELLERSAEANDRANVEEANPALLTSCFWPDASLDRLTMLAMMVIWQGRLDDAIESLEYENSERAQELRTQTNVYVGQYLLLPDAAQPPPTTSAMAGFRQVAQAVRRHYDGDQRMALKGSLSDYLVSTAQETRYIQGGDVPTDRCYRKLRPRTAGSGPLCALAEFASGTQLSSGLTKEPSYKLMLDSVSIIVGWTNDLLSLGKELVSLEPPQPRLKRVAADTSQRKNRTFSIVPILLWNGDHGGLKEVVEHVAGQIEKAIKDFDVCEGRLLNLYPSEADQIQQAVATLKTICTGNLTWSLQSRRYGVGEPGPDGSITMELKAA
ncbi:terpene synthase family protein [Colletotrichum sojae]|uniref:Terpene synthase n=1 Tax=Colletotrichum sojae TaxID=2175907 RepID=A0A8H6J1L0_9PEZI|nr:terpene synthase family protein [Colletotrichum sojae]